MSTAYFITHPDVAIDPAMPVPDWPLSERGRARMRAGLAQPWVRGIRAIHCSTERKAMDGAAILGEALGLAFTPHPALGENDRSATGYLPREEFEQVADEFFAHPEASVRGWERAADAQARVVGAVDAILAARGEGDIAIVSHGAVGALLLCRLMGVTISRTHDQPPGNGGFFYAFDAATRRLHHGWQRFDP
ncbi:MAG TPA: histidine phosphatase family protein [Acetobacteraceae bacterium]